jgi:hypothetical protein
MSTRGHSLVSRIRGIIKQSDHLAQFMNGVLDAQKLDISDLMLEIKTADGLLKQGLKGQRSTIKALKDADNLHHVFPKAKRFLEFFKKKGIDTQKVFATINGYIHQYGVHTPGTGGAYNQIWKDFIESPKGQRANPYYVLGFGLGLFEEIAPYVL